jgi:glycosyltransferase involved in cell wall biosynthesis
MKILVNSHSGAGGIARTTVQMRQEIMSNYKNDEMVILYENRESKKNSKHRYRNTTVYSMPTPGGVHTFNSFTKFKDNYRPFIKNLQKIIEIENPDLILIIGSFYFPWFLLQAAIRTGKVFIIRYGGIIEMEETKKIWLRLGKDFVDPSYYYIFPSDHSRKTVEEIHKTELPHSWVIHNGLPKEFFKKKKKRTNKKFKIGYVGRYYAVKNPEFCIALANKFKTGHNTEIEMVSSHVKNCNHGKKIPKAVRKFLKAGIKLRPIMTTARLARFYQSKDLIISPSHFETYGYVPLEAIAAGTPALINKTLGIKEVFSSLGLDELIADFNDLDHIMEKIEHIRKKKIIINDVISQRLKDEYSFSNTMLQFFDTFGEVLNRAS